MLRILTKPPVLLILALILAAGSALYLYHSGEIGESIGTGAGKMTGLATGSFKGVTDGLEKGLGFSNDIKLRTIKDGKRLRKPFFDLLQGLFVIQELTEEQKHLMMTKNRTQKLIKKKIKKTSRKNLHLNCFSWIKS